MIVFLNTFALVYVPSNKYFDTSCWGIDRRRSFDRHASMYLIESTLQYMYGRVEGTEKFILLHFFHHISRIQICQNCIIMGGVKLKNLQMQE